MTDGLAQRVALVHRVASRCLRAASQMPSHTVIYTAVFLAEMDQRRLLKSLPPIFPEVFADHMTLQFRDDLPDEDIEPDKLGLGRTIEMKVIGYAADERIQVAVVQPRGTRPLGRTPHITISAAPGVKPYYANSLLAGGFKPIPAGPILRGIVGWWDGQRVRTDW